MRSKKELHSQLRYVGEWERERVLSLVNVWEGETERQSETERERERELVTDVEQEIDIYIQIEKIVNSVLKKRQ